jgi:small subunit ribosomal protein S8
MQDPIADMLVRIKNAQEARHPLVTMNYSKMKEQIAKVLKQEGYINDYSVDNNVKIANKKLSIQLKYYMGKPVIERLKRISRSGLRVYKSVKNLKPVPGFGVEIITTSQGVMTQQNAKKIGVGGEIICEVA